MLLSFALYLFIERRDDIGKVDPPPANCSHILTSFQGVIDLITEYQSAIAEYHEEVNARVDRLLGEVVATMDDLLGVLPTL